MASQGPRNRPQGSSNRIRRNQRVQIGGMGAKQSRRLLGRWFFFGLFTLIGGPLMAQTPEIEGTGGILLPGEARTRALEDLETLERCQERPASPALQLQRLRSQYLLAVDSQEALRPAQELVDALARTPWATSTEGRPLVVAYRGSLRALEARHGFWPTRRIRDLREGFQLLDQQVTETPDHVEVRYLRLMSAAFLPGLFGRGDGVREDLQVLARTLPQSADALPQRTWTLMADAVEALLDEREPALAQEVRGEFSRARARAQVAAIPLVPPGCPASDE